MKKLYDDLSIGIPSGIRIDSCVIDKEWTAVRANGNVGIARTLQMSENPEELAATFTGAYLRDTANHMKWNNLALASVGVAAMNAWYNTKERAEGLNGLVPVESISQNAVFVGDYLGALPLPLCPDFDENVYSALKSTDTIVISADALTTRALSKLLDIVGDNSNVILEGWSLPCTALFFAFGMPVRELRGVYRSPVDSFEACANENLFDSDCAKPFCVRSDCVF